MYSNCQYLLFKPQDETHVTAPRAWSRREDKCALSPGQEAMASHSGTAKGHRLLLHLDHSLTAPKARNQKILQSLKPTLPDKEGE